MFGGVAVAGNLLCLAHAAARGKVFLVDLDEQRLMSFWEYGPEGGGYADAGGVAMGSDFAIYVADTRNDVVRVFSAFGKEVGRLGRPPEEPTGSVRRDRAGTLDRPRSVATHRGIVYVACGEGKLVRGVQRFRRSGAVLQPLRAFGEAEGRFGAPRGLCVSDRGVFVADTLHGAVQHFTLPGRYLGQFSTATNPGESSRPVAVTELADGDLLVADAGDNRGLRRFGRNGEQRFGAGVHLPELREPTALCTDEQGRVYVLDRDGERVQRLKPDLRPEREIVDLAEVLHEG